MSAKQARLADCLPYLLSITSNAVSDRIAAEYSSRFGLKIPDALLKQADKVTD